MKKILFLISIGLALGYTAKSQVDFNHTTTNPTGLITDTGADTMSYRLTGNYGIWTAQILLTKATGTLAGKSLLQVSQNGTNYVSVDSVTLANLTNGGTYTNHWVKAIPTKYIRIITNGGTTMSVTTAAKLTTE